MDNLVEIAKTYINNVPPPVFYKLELKRIKILTTNLTKYLVQKDLP